MGVLRTPALNVLVDGKPLCSVGVDTVADPLLERLLSSPAGTPGLELSGALGGGTRFAKGDPLDKEEGVVGDRGWTGSTCAISTVLARSMGPPPYCPDQNSQTERLTPR
mmetsp:Transcript_35700/g.93379  ORF Transcript_35700/g.93379 Transcript_35700/m.93379 type:complete len:109 (-) Transcript_35700:180-506(-)